MISAVGPEGDMHFSLIEGSCNSEAFIEYCRNLLADMKRPIFRIVDGASCHDSAATREFVASTEGRLRLFKLPGYSPELNPDERVWRNLKTHPVAKAGVRTRDEMKAILYKAAGRLSDCPIAQLLSGDFSKIQASPTLTPLCKHGYLWIYNTMVFGVLWRPG
jgi:transposase